MGNEAATRWRISDRQVAAVREATRNGAFEIVSLYSFGCGIDVCLHDELRGLCRAGRTTFTALKVDDMTNISSTRIRVRLLLTTLEERDGVQRREACDRGRSPQGLLLTSTAAAASLDRAPKPTYPKTLLFPNWLPTHMSFIKRAFASCGFDIAESQPGTGVNSGVALVGSDPCQTILSSVGQLAEYQENLAAQAAMSSLLESGCRDILFAQTFTCLSSHVSGSAKFKEVREGEPEANLSSVEYDTGISYVNQINRIKLLASLAKGAGDASS